MDKQLALAGLATASPLTLVAFLMPAPFGELLFIVVVVLFPLALIALGAARRGSVGWLRWWLALVGLLLLGSLLGIWSLAGRAADGPWLAGLPLAVVFQWLGMGVLPLVILVVVYAVRFGSPAGASREDER